MHSHHAFQLTFSLGGDFNLHLEDRVVGGPFAIVAPDAPHAFDAQGLMRKLFVAVALALVSVTPAQAHPDHDMYEQENPRLLALNSASYVVERMVERNAIPASWRDIQPNSALLRQRNGAMEWVVTFENPAITDVSERRLYVMLTQAGVYIAANYTGQ